MITIKNFEILKPGDQVYVVTKQNYRNHGTVISYDPLTRVLEVNFRYIYEGKEIEVDKAITGQKLRNKDIKELSLISTTLVSETEYEVTPGKDLRERDKAKIYLNCVRHILGVLERYLDESECDNVDFMDIISEDVTDLIAKGNVRLALADIPEELKFTRDFKSAKEGKGSFAIDIEWNTDDRQTATGTLEFTMDFGDKDTKLIEDSVKLLEKEGYLVIPLYSGISSEDIECAQEALKKAEFQLRCCSSRDDFIRRSIEHKQLFQTLLELAKATNQKYDQETLDFLLPQDSFYLHDEMKNVAKKALYKAKDQDWPKLCKDIRKIADGYLDRDDIRECKKDAETRKDFAKAFKDSKRDALDVAYDISYCLTSKDLRKLLSLHKQNRYRTKIEELLDYCDLIGEWKCIQEKKYDEFLKFIEKREAEEKSWNGGIR